MFGTGNFINCLRVDITKRGSRVSDEISETIVFHNAVKIECLHIKTATASVRSSSVQVESLPVTWGNVYVVSLTCSNPLRYHETVGGRVASYAGQCGAQVGAPKRAAAFVFCFFCCFFLNTYMCVA